MLPYPSLAGSGAAGSLNLLPSPAACCSLASLRGSCQERSASGLSSSSSPIHQRGQARHVGTALAGSAQEARHHTGTGQPSSALVWTMFEHSVKEVM